MARKSRKPAQSENRVEIKPAVSFLAWIYARISKDSDSADDSIENQIAICREYIDADNELTLGGEFTDLGYTGTDFDRPGYSEMMAGILCGDVKCVVVKDLSRLGRTYIEVGELLFDTFVQYGIRFVSVNDRYDSFADDAGRKKLLILFKNLVNHMYSKDLGRKIRSSHSAKKQRGELAGLPPYGYKRGDDGITLALDGDAAEIVKRVFNMRQAGESANSIAKQLTREGIPSPQSRRYQLGQVSHEKYSGRIVWNIGMVSKMLSCETYTGTLVQGKYNCNGKRHTLLPSDKWIRHENKHPAIISREQFEAVQKLKEETAEKYKKSTGDPLIENAYAGKIICTRCGKTAKRFSGGKRSRVQYYYCCRHCDYDLKDEHSLTRTPKLSLAMLDAVVMKTIQHYMDALIQFDDLAETLSRNDPLKERRALIAKDAKKLEKTVNDYENTLSTAYTHHLSGLLDFREYELIRAKMEREKQEAETRLKLIKGEQAKHENKSILENQWLVKYRAFRACEAPTKEMVQTLIGRIMLTPLSNEIEIVFNFTDEFEELKQIIHGNGGMVDE